MPVKECRGSSQVTLLALTLCAARNVANSGETADGLAVANLVDQLKPDILIADLMMPGLSGGEVTRQVSRRTPTMRVIILSMHMNEPHVLEALRNGARGL